MCVKFTSMSLWFFLIQSVDKGGGRQKRWFLLSGVGLLFMVVGWPWLAGGEETQPQHASTQVFVGTCGDGVVHPGQECDDGWENNIGVYSITIDGRTCGPDCKWYAYCGDGIVQSEHGEECDDGTNTDDGFCSADCKVIEGEPDAPDSRGGSGGGGGGGSFSPGSDEPIGPTAVTVQGRAYPNTSVNILKDGTAIGVVSTDSRANFTFTTDDVSPGATTFGFWAEDNLGLRSISYTTTFQVSEGAETTVNGVFIPPTIEIDEVEVDPGQVMEIYGQTAPEVDVSTHIHSEAKAVEETRSDPDGNWRLEFDTSALERGHHTAKSKYQFEEGGSTQNSSFSRSISFFLGVPAESQLTADLNDDGQVNLADFSILLFHWGTASSLADINNDSTVGLADFSIMLFQWTG